MTHPPLTELTRILRELDWSDGDLAHEIGVSRQYVALVRLGAKTPSPRFVRDVPLVLSRATELDPEVLRASIFVDDKSADSTNSFLGQRLEVTT